ncbi:hypothetical protein Rhopal_003483-T1 [Rhodotorula paludigena]|uniref:Uncharacterized protein n=1 Tax=Rhodotorula paludigena TaxID=86838 RepID=A0AAV5GN68_9BASI|nr:hypothetical protein Rhopal_003483-T1 [Rhodotorula paludigena]
MEVDHPLLCLCLCHIFGCGALAQQARNGQAQARQKALGDGVHKPPPRDHYARLLLPLPTNFTKYRLHLIRTLGANHLPPPSLLTLNELVITSKNITGVKQWELVDELAKWDARRRAKPAYFKLHFADNKLNENTSTADTAVWKAMAKRGPWTVEYETPVGMPDFDSMLPRRSTFRFRLQQDVNYKTAKVWLKRCQKDPEMPVCPQFPSPAIHLFADGDLHHRSQLESPTVPLPYRIPIIRLS